VRRSRLRRVLVFRESVAYLFLLVVINEVDGRYIRRDLMHVMRYR
jgi:hypothetical protein